MTCADSIFGWPGGNRMAPKWRFLTFSSQSGKGPTTSPSTKLVLKYIELRQPRLPFVILLDIILLDMEHSTLSWNIAQVLDKEYIYIDTTILLRLSIQEAPVYDNQIASEQEGTIVDSDSVRPNWVVAALAWSTFPVNARTQWLPSKKAVQIPLVA